MAKKEINGNAIAVTVGVAVFLLAGAIGSMTEGIGLTTSMFQILGPVVAGSGLFGYIKGKSIKV